MALSIASLLLPALGCSAQDEAGPDAVVEAPPPEQKQNPAPDFTLPDVHGNEVSLSDYRGKVVVIDFWATWCPPCIFQVPELNQLWSAHKDAGNVAVVGVAVDVEGAEVVAPWIEQEGVEYQILIGDERLAREFGAMGFPTLAIITPEGNIESLHVGLIELDELESLIGRMLLRRHGPRHTGKRPIRFPIVDVLSLAEDVDTEEEAREIEGEPLEPDGRTG